MSAAAQPDQAHPLAGPLWRDGLWALRFRRRKGRAVEWRRPSRDEARRWETDPRLAPYADWCEWRADVGAPENETWVVFSRIWSGWPDPPEYAFFALDREGEVTCAADFDHWPRAWRQAGADPEPKSLRDGR